MAYDLLRHGVQPSSVLTSPRAQRPMVNLAKLRYPGTGKTLELAREQTRCEDEKSSARLSWKKGTADAGRTVMQCSLPPLISSQSLPTLRPPLPTSRVAFKSQVGSVNHVAKPHNQDACFAIESKGWHLFGVCDGHGANGHLVSSYLKVFFPMYVFEGMTAMQSSDHAALTCLKHGFSRCENGLGQSTIDCMNSGSTCVTVLMRENMLACGNVGDSRAVLGRRSAKGWGAVPLTVDHKPELREEMQRIVSAGGEVCVSKMAHAGPPRVYMRGALFPGLAMSRSMGDMLAHSIGVSSAPDLFLTSITQDDKFVIVASDGVWEFISNLEAVKLVGSHWEEGDAAKACGHLISEAQIRWRRVDGFVDDITAVVAFLNA